MRKCEDILNDLVKIKELGFIKTHRAGNTGIGKTLEDLLKIRENNIPGPNGDLTELKAYRKGSPSMLTLFTKAPMPPKINTKLLNEFGYKNEKGKKALHTTVNAVSRNNLRNNKGFIINIDKSRIELDCPSSFIEIPYWDEYVLEESFNKKYAKYLLYVKADHRYAGVNEEFHYNEAYLMKGFSFKNFKDLLSKGKILIDIRIGQYSDGRPHDHGTGFRVLPANLDRCFSTRERVL